ncbi:MAG: lysylphosphatidylglycerol synthase transmembrane domain-containing protein [Anaerolineae bacterium]|nr:flippase-like domain-containing protein [Anaerolineae bacterium]MDW8098331.1 lysylphosphatidylglycerol synthase transmembrane domain-containing protein [Anaerolineae bacterium]
MPVTSRPLEARRYLSHLFKIAISAVLLASLLRSVDWRHILAELRQADLAWVALALGLSVTGLVVRAWRWEGLLSAQGVRAPLRMLIRWYFVGGFFNTVLPTGFGGDVVKTYALARYSDRPGAAAGSVLVDRFSGILSLLMMGGASLLAAPGLVTPAVAWLIWGFLAGALIVLGFMVGGVQLWLRRHIPFLTRTQIGYALLDAIPAYGLRPFLRALAISFLFNSLLVAINVCLAYSLGLRLRLVYFLIFVPLISLSLLLPSVGGLGVRELSYVTLFRQAGVSPAAATALSLLFYAVTLASGLLGGLMYLWPASEPKPSQVLSAPRRN